MKKGNRKHVRLLAMAMSLAVVGMLAAFIALAAQPEPAAAQGLCDGPLAPLLPQCEDSTTTPGTTPTPPTDGTTPTPGTDTPAGAMLESSSTSGGASVKLTLTITAAQLAEAAGGAANLSAGDRIEIYLEDDYSVPDTISASNVYIRHIGATGIALNGGGRVSAADVDINTSDHFTPDKDDYAISILLPDMDPRDDEFSYASTRRDLTVVIEKDAGINNPTEKGEHSVGFSILTGNEEDNKGPEVTLPVLETVAKISISDAGNTRGYDMTVIGSGFNNGTTADVFVLSGGSKPATCLDLVGNVTASNVGSALVGSDHRAAVTFTVTVPTFEAGPENYICMRDGEGRTSATDVESFELEASIRVVPSIVSAGDTVNVFAEDFPVDGVIFGGILISEVSVDATGGPIRAGSATATFEVPGNVNDLPLQGTVRVDATWGETKKNSKITVTGSELNVSNSAVLPNETVTITGNGYGSQTCINPDDITLDNVPVMVDAESIGNCVVDGVNGVEVSNAGQFVATITLWSSGSSNPTLIPGTHILSVEDSQGFSGSSTVMIAEPTVTVTPNVLGPRDYLVVTGENWPMDNPDNPLTVSVTVEIDDFGVGRSYPVYADNSGRFTVEHRVHRNVAIPSTNQVTATYESVVKVGSFSVPAATVTVTPSTAQPGDLISISATDMPVYTAADQVKIGGTEFNDPGVNSDRDGNITIDGLLVPGLDPGTYSVLLNVNGTIAIGEIEVQAEDSAAGPGAMLPDAMSELDDSLVRVFHFNGVDKTWSFFDPRPEFDGLNTLTTMVNGEPYWILVSEDQTNVLLNGRSRNLTCVGGDCWNQLVW